MEESRPKVGGEGQNRMKLNTNGKHKEDGTSDIESFLNDCRNYIVKSHGASSDASSDISDNDDSTTGDYRTPVSRLKAKGKKNRNYKRVKRRSFSLDASSSSELSDDHTAGQVKTNGKRSRNYKRIRRRLASSDSSSVSSDNNKGNSKVESDNKRIERRSSATDSSIISDDEEGNSMIMNSSRNSRKVEPVGKGDKVVAMSSKIVKNRCKEPVQEFGKELNRNGNLTSGLHTTSGSSFDGDDDDDRVEAAAATSSKKTGTSLNETNKDEAKYVYFSGESSTGDPDIGVAYLQMKIQQSIDEGNHRESFSDETSVFSSSSDGRELSRMCTDFQLMDQDARNRRVTEFLNKWCPCDEDNKDLMERIEQAKSKRKSVGATLENIVLNSPKLFGREAREIEVDLGVFQRRRASRRKREAKLFHHFLSKLKDDKKGTPKKVGGNKRKREDVRAPDCENGGKSTKRLRGGKRQSKKVSVVSLEQEPQPEQDCAGSSRANGESSTFPFKQSRKLYSRESWLSCPRFLALHQDK